MAVLLDRNERNGDATVLRYEQASECNTQRPIYKGVASLRCPSR